jgi:RHS repeat-associated protein
VVQHYSGALVEESHYYAFGLLQKGISSRVYGRIINKEKTFQGQRFDDELGLNWVQFKWRNHDPQIGRFIEIDPLSEKYDYNSTYAFSENKVVRHVELEGLESWDFMSTLRNLAGYEHTTSKSFAKNMVEVAKNPNTYKNAIGLMGPALGAVVLGIATGGVGEGTFIKTSINTGVRTEVATTGVTTAIRTTSSEMRTVSATQGEMSHVTIYRGVNESSPGYSNAIEGKVVPKGGTATPVEHNMGNTNSNYTSWTTNPEVAKNYALRPSGQGVVLEATVPKAATTVSPSLKSVNLIQSPGTIVNESEVLMKGIMTAGKALKVKL